ncbi:MAG TPA: trypsin-like peptidase domain-containing protein [Terriglobia bacterium]|nr:trypsin-like peptidase domain-containing protein [Terriglobia bacterium]
MLAVFCLFLTVPLAEAQTLLTYKKPDPSVPPLGVVLKRAVVNLELQCKEGNSLVPAAGTGFLVAYTDPRLPKGQFFQYLVTNRHVAECWDLHNHPRGIQVLRIRVNTNDGSSRRLDANPAAWRFPTDDSVDLAAMPVVLPDDLLIASIPVEEFATKDFMSSNRIAEGSPILLSGYFYQFPGERRSQSIVRQGILSMVPDEPMTTTTGKPGTVYLADVHIFSGNSGSPVEVSADWIGVGGFHFLGVISGYYYEDENFDLEIATTVKGTARANSGVAMIVPADFLKALLDEADLKGVREAYFSRTAGARRP